MAKYSTPEDIGNVIIRPLSTEADHEAAESYICTVFAKISMDSKDIEVTPMLKDLSVIYATYRSAFCKYKTKKDIFYQIYDLYIDKLRAQTTKVIEHYRQRTFKTHRTPANELNFSLIHGAV